jgi:hypothetical protein
MKKSPHKSERTPDLYLAIPLEKKIFQLGPVPEIAQMIFSVLTNAASRKSSFWSPVYGGPQSAAVNHDAPYLAAAGEHGQFRAFAAGAED